MKTLKNKIKEQNLTIGSWLSFSYPPLCEMMAKAGFDWLVIDMEHTAIDYSDAQQLIQIIDLAGCVPLVRVGENHPLIIKRVMEAGAHGVIVPMVNNAKDARKAVEAVYYPPFGKRGVGLFRAQNYGLGFKKYKEWAEKESIIIVQIEHIQAVENLDDILSVDGVDGFIVGPYDLSASLGHPGNFGHPIVEAALNEIQRTVTNTSKVGGYHIVHSNHNEILNKIESGYKFIAYGDDMIFIAEKLREEVSFIEELNKAK